MKNLMRLDAFLSLCGFGTRKEVRSLISQKIVQVNGKTQTKADTKVDAVADKIFVRAECAQYKENIYLMMNKERGFECSAKSHCHTSVFSLLKDEYLREYPGGSLQCIGRLDVETEGLLLFTSDGLLNHQLTSPRYNVEKTYFVRLKNAVPPATQETYTRLLANGIHVQEEGHAPAFECKSAQLTWLSDSTCRITVFEGKFHEVRRIFRALNCEVVFLKRLSMGGLSLDETLTPSAVRELSEEEVATLKNACKNGKLGVN